MVVKCISPRRMKKYQKLPDGVVRLVWFTDVFKFWCIPIDWPKIPASQSNLNCIISFFWKWPNLWIQVSFPNFVFGVSWIVFLLWFLMELAIWVLLVNTFLYFSVISSFTIISVFFPEFHVLLRLRYWGRWCFWIVSSFLVREIYIYIYSYVMSD